MQTEMGAGVGWIHKNFCHAVADRKLSLGSEMKLQGAFQYCQLSRRIKVWWCSDKASQGM